MKELLRIFADADYDKAKQEILEKVPNNGETSMDAISIINYFLYAGGIAAIVMIIVAGIQMTTSAGDAGAVAKAKKTMTWAIVGLAVMILAYAIVNFVLGRL